MKKQEPLGTRTHTHSLKIMWEWERPFLPGRVGAGVGRLLGSQPALPLNSCVTL